MSCTNYIPPDQIVKKFFAASWFQGAFVPYPVRILGSEAIDMPDKSRKEQVL
jgi:hypothetical protein